VKIGRMKEISESKHEEFEKLQHEIDAEFDTLQRK